MVWQCASRLPQFTNYFGTWKAYALKFLLSLTINSPFQESLDLQNRQARPVAVTCMSFFYNDVNKFLVGSEECLGFQGQRHGTKPGLSIQFDGHTGPITSVSTHRAAGGQVGRVSGCDLNKDSYLNVVFRLIFLTCL